MLYSRYTPKLYLIVHLSVKWLISVILNARNVSGKKVSKVPGVVDQVSKRGEVQFYALKVQIYPGQFLCQKIKLIG